MELTKRELKRLGIRLPSGVKLLCNETDKEYQFSFAVKKVGKRS